MKFVRGVYEVCVMSHDVSGIVYCVCGMHSRPEMATIKLVLGDCEALSVQLPCADRLRTLLQTASKWTSAVESALVSSRWICASSSSSSTSSSSLIKISNYSKNIVNVRTAEINIK